MPRSRRLKYVKLLGKVDRFPFFLLEMAHAVGSAIGVATSIETSKQELLRDLLKQVSRLFYTTLVVVPADVRDQVSLAYLFARAATQLRTRN